MTNLHTAVQHSRYVKSTAVVMLCFHILLYFCRLVGCPRAAVSQTARELGNKSPSSSSKRLAKTKTSTSAGISEDPNSYMLEGRSPVKRVTRHNGGGGVEDVKLLEKVSFSKQGTAAALMGGKRSGTALSNEPHSESAQSSRRFASDKLVGKTNSFQRKVAKAKRASDETVVDLKIEGGLVKRKRVENGAEQPQNETDIAMLTTQNVVKQSIIEEVVESTEVDITEDNSTRLPDDQGAFPQQDDINLGADNEGTTISQTGEEEQRVISEDQEVAVSENTSNDVTEEAKKKEEVCRVDSKKHSDCVATLSGKSEEYFPSLESVSEVFSDGDDVENLLRIEQRCASVQSWVARHSHEESEVEPSVEQMDVEEEVTVEGDGTLIVETSALSNIVEVSEKVSVDTNKAPEAEEVTGTKSCFDSVAAADRCSVEDEEPSPENQVYDVSESSVPPVVGESVTTQSLEVTNIEEHSHQHSEAVVDLIREESDSELKIDSTSLTYRDVDSAEIPGVVAELSEENIPLAVVTDNTVFAVDVNNSNVNRKSSTDEGTSDANICHTTDQGSAESAGAVPCSASSVIELGDKDHVSYDMTEMVGQQSVDMKPVAVDCNMSAQCNSAASITSPQNDSSPAVPGADEDASSKAADSSVEKPPGAALTTDKEADDLQETADEPDKSSSQEVNYNNIESEDGKPSSSEPVASTGETMETGSQESSERPAVSTVVSAIQSGPAPVVAAGKTSVSVVVARTCTSTVAGSGGPAVTSVVPGFVGMPPVAIRAAVPGSAVGSVFVHVADPRQFAMHLQQQQQQQGHAQGPAQTPVFHIPALSPQHGAGPPQIVMSPLSPQQVALLSSSLPATTQPPHQLMGGVPPRHVTLVTSGPRPQLLQQCLLTSSGPQPLALLPAAQPASASNSTSGASSTTSQPSVPVQHLAILSHALQGGAATATTTPTSGHQQPVTVIAAGSNQTPVMRMAPAAMIPRHPMSASSAMQHLTSAVQQTISLQQLQLSFAAAAAAAQQQQMRSPVPIPRLPVLGSTQPSAVITSSSTHLTVVSLAAAPVVSMPVSPMVSVAASALTAFLKKDNVMASQLLPPPATTIAKLSPHDVALKGDH